MVCDDTNQPTRVIGIISGHINGRTHEKEWNTAIYEKIGNQWILQPSTLPVDVWKTTGYHLITASGTFAYYDSSQHKNRFVRDFTEVGHDRIEETYEFIADRLRS